MRVLHILIATLWLIVLSTAARAQAGSVDTFNPASVNTGITALAYQPDGKIVVCGSFSTLGGGQAQDLARLHSDGTIDLTFAGTFDGQMHALAVQPDGKILLAGQFKNPAGTADAHIARLLPNGSWDPNFNARTDTELRCVAVQQDGKILIGGTFDSVNGVTRKKFARLNPDGSLDPTFFAGTGAPNYVYNITVQPDGKILLAGAFGSINGQPRNRIARLNPDGTLESLDTFNPGSGANVSIQCLKLQPDGKILVAGGFTTFNGEPRTRIARLEPNGALESLATFNPGTGTDATILTMGLQADGKILIGGDFTTYNTGGRNYFARLNPDGSRESSTTFVLGTAGDFQVQSQMIQPDGRVLLSGYFTRFNGQIRYGLARLRNDPVTQTLTVSPTGQIDWLRGGASPEVNQITLEVSTNGGSAWTLLGPVSRIPGGWRLSAAALPSGGLIRARGRVSGSIYNGSTGLVEQITAYDIATEPAVFSPPTPAISSGLVTLPYTIPEASLAGSASLVFSDGQIARAFTLTAPAASLGVHSIALDPKNPLASAGIASGDPLPDGVYSVKIGYRDSLGNALVYSNAHQVIIDSASPTLTVPAPLVLEAQSALGSLGVFDLTAQDLLDPAPVATSTPSSGSVFPLGTTLVEASAVDWAGNSVGREFTVTVQDTTPPNLESNPAPLVIATGVTGTVDLPNYLPTAVATDAVGVTSLTQSPPAGSPRIAGTTIVTISASDAAGNTRSINFDVSVADGTKPAIDPPAANFAPATLTTGADGSVPLPDYRNQAVTSDNVGVTAVTQIPAPGSARLFGTTTIVLTAHDAMGNTQDLTFNVPVLDGTKPTIAAPEGNFSPLEITTGLDGTAPLPNFTTQAVTADNVAVTSVTQSPAIGSAQVAGTSTVTVTAHDAAENTTSVSFDVAVADGTKPEIAAPPGGFTSLTVVAGDAGTSPLPDYTSQAVTSDNVGVTSVTQFPLPGDVRLFGKTQVTLTAHDAAGNTRDLQLETVVVLAAPLVNSVGAVGTLVPGAGIDPRIPSDALFTSLGIPAVDDRRNVSYLAKWKGADGIETAIFSGNPATLLLKVGDDAPGIPGGKFKTLQDPVVAPDGGLTFLGTVKGQGITPSGDLGLWHAGDGTLELLLREGASVAGLGKLKAITNFSVRNGEVLALGKLAPARGSITAANDTVLLRLGAEGASVLLREGAMTDLQDGLGAAPIKSLSALLPAAGSPGQGRTQADGSALASLTIDKRTALVRVAADGSFHPRLQTGDPASAVGSDAYWHHLGAPALETSGQAVVSKATLKAQRAPGVSPTVTAKNDTALIFETSQGAGFEIFAREGAAAPGLDGATYLSFLDPLVNDGGQVAYLAKLAGRGLNVGNNTAVFWGAPDSPAILARLGSPAPDRDGAPTSALWSKFISLALPSGPDAGPVFLADLRGPGVVGSPGTELEFAL